MKDQAQARRVTAEAAAYNGQPFYLIENKAGDRWEYWGCTGWDTERADDIYTPRKKAKGWRAVARVDPRGRWLPVVNLGA